ncbi:class I SAM-dependent methyltransferase [Falsiroseomonas sp. HW251]|uniref:class I SAM-dependent methyltransferase n=1 Tax=Falsiroseomonas sp. HW251 TaxID=3390998 RepID=UPI003D311BC7
MSEIRFEDGAAYERSMGVWSSLAGEVFLDWLAPAPGGRWLDVGCGNGAFTEQILRRSAPAEVQALDPSEGQLAFARGRPGARAASFRQGDALSLPFEDRRFDVAAMALVVFFVPDPAKAVAEMMRVVRPGGVVAAYAWDFSRGGFPFEVAHAELRAMGHPPPRPPHWAVAARDPLAALWRWTGLRDVELRDITVRRHYPGFDAFWDSIVGTATLARLVATLPPAELAALRERLAARLTQPDGSVAYDALATAVRGTVPA